jgi:hypothetical protein
MLTKSGLPAYVVALVAGMARRVPPVALLQDDVLVGRQVEALLGGMSARVRRLVEVNRLGLFGRWRLARLLRKQLGKCGYQREFVNRTVCRLVRS